MPVITAPELWLLDRFACVAPEGALVVDVGANVGEWSYEALQRRPDLRVVAFEPQVGAFAQLCELLPSVEKCNYGLSDRSGKRVMRASEHPDSLQATLVERSDEDSYHASGLRLDRREEVRMERLDEVIPDDRIHLLKIDVEGHELAVLEGTELGHVDIVQFEFNDCALHAGIALHSLVSELAEFDVYALGEGALEGVRPDYPLRLHSGWIEWCGPVNYVALRHFRPSLELDFAQR